jgi:ribulose-5-phosphate 4-epimerase/fuculose-1-phosphate aldolase
MAPEPSWSVSVRDRVTPEEWEQRVALAAVYRLVAHFQWDDLIFTHLSARVPGGNHHFLINPYGMTFDEITASSLVKVTSVAIRSGFTVRDQSSWLHNSQRHPCSS